MTSRFIGPSGFRRTFLVKSAIGKPFCFPDPHEMCLLECMSEAYPSRVPTVHEIEALGLIVECGNRTCRRRCWLDLHGLP
jgi:hypothetical protein